jgi:hypothetical protein
MSVGIRLKFSGGTQEQYDALHGHMRIDADPPGGLIFHSAGPIDEGWGILDFWESRETFDTFVSGRLMPAAQELGDRAMPGAPDVHEFPVHHVTKP